MASSAAAPLSLEAPPPALPTIDPPPFCMDVADILADHPACEEHEAAEDEAVVFVDAKLFDALAAEARQMVEAIEKGALALEMREGRARCPLCPWRSFGGRCDSTRRGAALGHLRRYHLPKPGAQTRVGSFAPGGEQARQSRQGRVGL